MSDLAIKTSELTKKFRKTLAVINSLNLKNLFF